MGYYVVRDEKEDFVLVKSSDLREVGLSNGQEDRV